MGVVCDHGGACVVVIFLIAIARATFRSLFKVWAFIARASVGLRASPRLCVFHVVDRGGPGRKGGSLPGANRVVA